MAEDRWDRMTGYFCASCAYCSPKKSESSTSVYADVGRCRRHAPTMEGFPVVYLHDDWCGDHKLGTNPHKKE